MPQPDPTEITRILNQINDGHPSAADELLPLVYDELRALASSFFRHQPAGHTLQPTALVHEAYARMVAPPRSGGGGGGGDDESSEDRFNSRSHFMAVAAKAMRQILANHARDRRRIKRGGGWRRVTLNNAITPSVQSDVDLLVIDEALSKLAALDPRQSTIVELRFFADMKVEEIARVLDTSVSTIEREWRMARAFLNAELTEADSA